MIVLCIAGVVGAETTVQDEETPDGGWLFVPIVFYTPETRLAGGSALGYFYRPAPGVQSSGVQSLLFFTQNRQFILALIPRLTLDGGKYRLDGILRISRYPDEFFGVGSQTTAGENYTENIVNTLISFQKEIRPHLLVGPQVALDYSRISSVEQGGLLASGTIPGRESHALTGAGILASYDTRDNRFAATEGALLEASALYYHGLHGSRDYSFLRWYFDARYFHHISPRQVVAVQGLLDMAQGDAPFQLLPYVGGAQSLRGYREGRYRDNATFMTQAEYRLHLFWRFGMVAFAGMARSASSPLDLATASTHLAAGGGLRIRVNDQGINFRIDYGVGEGDSGLYITALEAF